MAQEVYLMGSDEPVNLGEWRAPTTAGGGGRLFTCGRPGRGTFGREKRPIDDETIARGFRNRWELIINYEQYEARMDSSEDLEDLLGMKKAITLEDYELRRN